MSLSAADQHRFARHIVMDAVGADGQQKLFDARVLVVGVGGLGSPILLYLTACGVGTLGIVDFDTVDISNLQRQILHTEYDVGTAKVSSAKDSIAALRSETIVHTHHTRMDETQFAKVAKTYDIIVDATDNFASRYAINRVAVRTQKPLVSGSLQGFCGQLLCVGKNTACYQCTFPTAPAPQHATTCETAGVLGSVAGVIGTLQATEVLKIILRLNGVLYNKILTIDTQTMQFKTYQTQKNPTCPCCGQG